MGIGMVLICSKQVVTEVTVTSPQARIIGEIVKTKNEKKVTID